MRRSAPFIILAIIIGAVGLLTVAPRVERFLQKRAAIAPSAAQPTVGPTTLFPSLAGDELRAALHDYAAAGHDPLSYRRAREIVYWQLDNEADHVVAIYERRRLELDSGEWPDPELINTEHLWPQSRGAGSVPAKSDLFHIRPSVPRVNSVRSNLPFGSPIAPFDHDAASGWRQGHEADGDEVFLPPPGERGTIEMNLALSSPVSGVDGRARGCPQVVFADTAKRARRASQGAPSASPCVGRSFPCHRQPLYAC